MTHNTKKTRTIPNPVPEDESLYNIYTLSFNNIKGSSSHVVRGRILVSIKRLEERLRDMIAEYQFFKVPLATVSRRSFAEHSALSWRVTRSNGSSKYTNFQDEELQALFQNLDGPSYLQLQSFDNELRLLNSNLKIEWLKYFELCNHASELREGEPMTPKMMPKCLDPST